MLDTHRLTEAKGRRLWSRRSGHPLVTPTTTMYLICQALASIPLTLLTAKPSYKLDLTRMDPSTIVTRITTHILGIYHVRMRTWRSETHNPLHPMSRRCTFPRPNSIPIPTTRVFPRSMPMSTVHLRLGPGIFRRLAHPTTLTSLNKSSINGPSAKILSDEALLRRETYLWRSSASADSSSPHSQLPRKTAASLAICGHLLTGMLPAEVSYGSGRSRMSLQTVRSAQAGRCSLDL